ncbi:MAG TPA: M20/M25/M40 family metallo-hydrolase [Thermoanaerobaculia bacterium]|nr:M20/M25/M40 family metallo-hydrolase [Thermoanaerobaculia bacterium]
MDEAAKRRRHRNERIAAALFVLAALATLFAFLRWNRQQEEAFRRERTYIPKPDTITPEVLLLRDYLRIDTTNPPGNEILAARWLAARLQENGIASEIIESAPGRANLYARIRGKQRGGGLLLLNHTDVVPAEAKEWSQPPFAGNVKFNMLWGRGALDMKSIGLCELFAFIDVAKSGVQPEHDLVFLAVADEERGGGQGMRWLIEHRPDVIDGVRYAIDEGGIVETKEERVIYFGIEIGSKQTVSLVLRSPAKEPLMAARKALEPYISRREPERITPEVRRFLRELAPTRVEVQHELADIDRSVAEGTFWKLAAGYRELTQNVVWAGWPAVADDGQWELSIALANLPDENPDARIAWVRSLVEPHGVSVTVTSKNGPVPYSSADSDFYRLIASEAARKYQTRAGTEILHRSTSDSRYLRVRGIDAYGVFPYPVDWFQTGGIHGKDERIRLDWFLDGIDLTRRIVRAYVFGQR